MNLKLLFKQILKLFLFLVCKSLKDILYRTHGNNT